jgi:hypothetical protein
MGRRERGRRLVGEEAVEERFRRCWGERRIGGRLLLLMLASCDPSRLLDRFFPLVHITSMVALAIYVVFVYEPARRMAT